MTCQRGRYLDHSHTSRVSFGCLRRSACLRSPASYSRAVPHAATDGVETSLGRLLRLPWLPRLPRAPPLPPAGVTGVAGEEADTVHGVPAPDDGDAAMGERATSVGWNVPVEMTECHIRIASLNDSQ